MAQTRWRQRRTGSVGHFYLQRGGRPMVQMLPHRVDAKSVKIVEGADLEPLVADNFLLVPLPRDGEPKNSYRVVFMAKRIGH